MIRANVAIDVQLHPNLVHGWNFVWLLACRFLGVLFVLKACVILAACCLCGWSLSWK